MPSALRILSCNLYSGQADPSALIRTIALLEPDVVCLQELGASLASALAGALPEGELAPNAINRGMGMLSRGPISIARFPMPRRDGWVARLSPPDWPRLPRPVEIMNVHILAPHTWPYFPRRDTRAGQFASLLSRLESSGATPWAVMGDFNSSPAWPFYKRMASRYVDAAHACRNGSPAPPTWPHAPRIGLRGVLRIDHCFVSGLVPRASSVFLIPGSDHLGLCVDLEIGDPEGVTPVPACPAPSRRD